MSMALPYTTTTTAAATSLKMSMALCSSSRPHLASLPQPNSIPNLLVFSKPCLTLKPKNHPFLLVSTWATDNGSGGAALTVEEKDKAVVVAKEPKVESLGSNETLPVATPAPVIIPKFEDPRWVNGTWDLSQFQKDQKTDWDAVIDAEARRRKWLEQYPESSSNEDPVFFDTSIVPWWAWVKRYHLPEAELLNGRAAMIGFFMAYLVDSLTGLGVVDQMNNFVCKTLLFVSVAGVLLIRKNEDIGGLKKLIEESAFYDKQWQATWKDE